MTFLTTKILGIVAIQFVLSAGGASAAALTGNALVQALSGKSFTCTADGKPMTINFSDANKKGDVKYSVKWKGQTFKSKYKLDKKGNYSNNGKKRAISREGTQIVISGTGVPTAYCEG